VKNCSEADQHLFLQAPSTWLEVIRKSSKTVFSSEINANSIEWYFGVFMPGAVYSKALEAEIKMIQSQVKEVDRGFIPNTY
jgi:hypothetical protein